jgi:hypothetical protein
LGAALSLKLKESSVRSSSIHIAKVFWSFLSKLGKLAGITGEFMSRPILPPQDILCVPNFTGNHNRS